MSGTHSFIRPVVLIKDILSSVCTSISQKHHHFITVSTNIVNIGLIDAELKSDMSLC